MTKNALLVALFLLSLAAGVWMFRSREAADLAEPASCTTNASCSAGTETEPAAEPGTALSEEVVPPPAAPPPARSPAPDGTALREEADRLLAEGKVLEGVKTLRRATEADPTAKNHGDLGDLLQRMTAIDEALVHLRQAAELDPGNADRWIALANGYYRAVDPGEAWKAEKRAKEAEPGLVLGRDKNGNRVRQGDSEPRKP